MINAVAIPAVEKTCRALFQEINESFHKGLSEFMANLANVHDEIIESSKADESDGYMEKFDRALFIKLTRNGELITAVEQVRYL